MSSDFGDRPLPLKPYNFCVSASQMMAKMSPPIPQLAGSTRPSTALAAMAASRASFLQDVQRGLSGQGLAGSGHAIFGQNLRSGGERLSGESVLGLGGGDKGRKDQ